MNASEQAKAAGLPSLAQVSQMTGVSTQTLNNWHKTKPQLFAVVLAGCVVTEANRKAQLANNLSSTLSPQQWRLLDRVVKTSAPKILELDRFEEATMATLVDKGLVKKSRNWWGATTEGFTVWARKPAIVEVK